MSVDSAVLYHKGCPDGFGAAYAAWLELGDTAEYIPMQYGGSIPDLPYNIEWVYILDFSFSRPNMEILHRNYGSSKVILLDHHESALENLEGLENCHINLCESGATMAWNWFNTHDEMPLLMKYIKDRDLWEWKLPCSKEISAYINSLDHDFNEWHRFKNILQTDFNYVVDIGDHFLRLQNKQVEQIISTATLKKIDGVIVPTVNSPILQSEIGHALLDEYPNRKFSGIWYEYGKSRKWSLRSREGFSVKEIAKKFGGGGHPQAAGFTEKI